MGKDRENRQTLEKWESRKGELRELIVDKRKLSYKAPLEGEHVALEPVIVCPREAWEELDYRERQWLKVEAAAMASLGAVLCGRSAARKLGIWVVAPEEEKIEVTLPSRGVSKSRQVSGGYEFRCSTLRSDEVMTFEGHRVTSPARTAIDIARHHGFVEGLIAMDYLLRRGKERDEIERVLRKMGRAKGIAVARRCVEHAVEDSESPYESMARALLIDAGIGPVVTQYRIGDRFVDLLVEAWLVVEIDGAMKYQGPDAERVRLREIERQKQIENKGYVFLRYPPAFIRNHPEKFIREVRETLAGKGLVAARIGG